MTKRIKNDKVISKRQGERKTLNKDTKNKISICLTLLNKYKVYFILSFILILTVIGITFGINKNSYNTKIVSIDNYTYNKSDYMIYIYSAKYNYYKDKVNDITSEDLNVMYDDENKMTMRDYLKEVAISDIKTASAIKSIASKNNIELTNKDRKELDKEKKSFIKSLGGMKEYRKFLKKNNTTDKSYDKMSETDKLYKRIIKKLYSNGKINDLTEEEKNDALSSYKDNYMKIKQIVLTIVDLNTGKNLNSTTINQKEALAKNIVSEARSGANFDDLIKKYSEANDEDDNNYELYYKNGELLSELEDKIKKLSPGEVSEPIKTKYAYHIIRKLELDDKKLNSYYDDLREEKCIKDIKDALKDLKITYYGAYEKIKIK